MPTNSTSLQVVKNINSMGSKGVNEKIIPQCTVFHETLSLCKI